MAIGECNTTQIWTLFYICHHCATVRPGGRLVSERGPMAIGRCNWVALNYWLLHVQVCGLPTVQVCGLSTCVCVYRLNFTCSPLYRCDMSHGMSHTSIYVFECIRDVPYRQGISHMVNGYPTQARDVPHTSWDMLAPPTCHGMSHCAFMGCPFDYYQCGTSHKTTMGCPTVFACGTSHSSIGMGHPTLFFLTVGCPTIIFSMGRPIDTLLWDIPPCSFFKMVGRPTIVLTWDVP